MLIIPRDTGHRVEDHIAIQNEVIVAQPLKVAFPA